MTERNPDLRVQFTKRTDGTVIFRCTRPDGSATWQRQNGRQAVFFPFHDLTHYSVESVLRFREGFYGLLAAGWEVVDTTGKGARGPLPLEAVLVEHIVGLLERERMGGAAPMTAEEFNAQLELLARDGRVVPTRAFTDGELDAVRRRVDALHGKWAALDPGATLELTFDRAAVD